MFMIRDYADGDLADAVHLLETLKDDPETVQIDHSQFFVDASERAPTVVAVAQDEIVGLLTARTFGTTAWILTLAVSRSWRRQGVGTGLVERLEHRLAREGVRRISTVLEPGQTLSGLKDQVRKRQEGFSEKDFGYSGFLQFCKAAVARGVLQMDWEEDDEEYYLYVPEDAAG